jgi:hypothetical protein
MAERQNTVWCDDTRPLAYLTQARMRLRLSADSAMNPSARVLRLELVGDVLLDGGGARAFASSALSTVSGALSSMRTRTAPAGCRVTREEGAASAGVIMIVSSKADCWEAEDRRVRTLSCSERGVRAFAGNERVRHAQAWNACACDGETLVHDGGRWRLKTVELNVSASLADSSAKSAGYFSVTQHNNRERHNAAIFSERIR